MNIDIAESLLASWLRHERKCQIVQTNWKAPTWQPSDEKKVILEDAFSTVKNHFETQRCTPIFKKLDSSDQLMKQIECDVVGVRWHDNGGVSLHIGEIAYHAKGLNYKDTTKTRSCEFKVIAKIIYGIFAAYYYWNIDDIEIIFASPKVHAKRAEKIIQLDESLAKIKTKLIKKFKLKRLNVYIALNDKFKQDIIQPIKRIAASDYTNLNELYLRSIQLFLNNVDFLGNEITKKEEDNEAKIGELVQDRLKPLIKKINDERLINDLCELEYSKANFKLNYPLLVATHGEYAKKHHNRYYVEEIYLCGRSYRITSQWYSRNQTPLIRWMENLQKKLSARES